METTVFGGTKVEDKEFAILTELLMLQLLKLDSIAADGEAKVHRRFEVDTLFVAILVFNYYHYRHMSLIYICCVL